MVVPDLCQDLVAPSRVQAGGRLVQDEHLGPHGDDARDGHTPLLAARQRKGRLPGERRVQADKVHGLAHAPLDLGVGQAHVVRAEGDVLGDGLLKELVFRILEHQADGKAGLALALALLVPDRVAGQQDLARGRLQKPVEVLDEGGLARAGMADDAQDLTLFDLDIDMVERRALEGSTCAINLGQVSRF